MLKGSVEVKDSPIIKGESIPHRYYKNADALVETPDKSIVNLYDILKYSAQNYPNRPALGERSILNIIKEEKTLEGGAKKEWSYFELSDYKLLVFVQLPLPL